MIGFDMNNWRRIWVEQCNPHPLIQNILIEVQPMEIPKSLIFDFDRKWHECLSLKETVPCHEVRAGDVVWEILSSNGKTNAIGGRRVKKVDDLRASVPTLGSYRMIAWDDWDFQVVDPGATFLIDERVAATVAAPDLSKYPHSCPRCGKAAYIGLNTIDCSQPGCR